MRFALWSLEWPISLSRPRRQVFISAPYCGQMKEETMRDRKTTGTKTKLASALVASGLIVAVAVMARWIAPTTVWTHVGPSPWDFTTGGGDVYKDDASRI